MFEIVLGVLVPLVAGLVISFCIEQFLHPRPRLRTRHAQAFAMHSGLWLVLFGVGLAIWQRPYFASGLNLLGMLLIVLVSNTKFATLREPFLFFDFRFFKALLRHPRLYLPFFGVWSAVACAAGFVVLCVIALRVEPSMLSQLGFVSFTLCCLISLSIGTALLWIGMRTLVPIALDPVRDLQTLGLLGSFVRYWQEERANSPKMVAKKLRGIFQPQPKSPTPQHLPHLVAVQCESFFDARRVLNGINPDVLMIRAWMAPSITTGALEHGLPLEVLAHLLGGGQGSRLYVALVDSGLATSAGASYDSDAVGATDFSVYAAPRRGTSHERVEEVARSEIARLLDGGVTEEEVARSRRQMTAGALLALDSFGAAPRMIGNALAIGLPLDDVEYWPARIRAVTREQVQTAARAVLDRAPNTTGWLLPADA